MSGRTREAIPQFERVLKADPKNLPAALSLGSAHLSLGDPANAIAPLTTAVKLDPANPNARGMLAGALLTVRRAKEAAAHYRKLTSMGPGDPKGWSGLGRSYEVLAAQAYRELSKLGEGSAEWLALVAESRLAQRQYRSAFFFFKQALEKNPDLRGAHEGLANVYRSTNHPDWAAAEEGKERALGPMDCAKEKAACDFHAGRFAEAAATASPYWRSRAYNELAREAFAKLGTLPESVELHAIRAEIAANQNRPLQAAEEWRAALKLAPGDPRLEQELAIALHAAGDYNKARQVFESLLKREPRSAELNFFAGDSYLRLEQPDNAVPYLASAVRYDPKLLPAHASLGLAYVRVGRAADAIKHLETALQLDDDGSLYYQLARAYQSAGEAVKAKQILEKYQDKRTKLEAEKRDLEEKVQITAP
jgi:predicted Zn-dependent protease